jgi:hypothetical protein
MPANDCKGSLNISDFDVTALGGALEIGWT